MDMKDIIRIFQYSWSLRRYYISIGFFVVVTALLNLVTPFTLKFIVDGLVALVDGEEISMGYFIVLVSINFGASITTTFISNFSGYLGDMLSVKLYSLLSKKYFEHLLSLPIRYFDDQTIGKITSRLDRGISTISQMMQSFANNFSGLLLTSVFTLVILAYYSWPVALFLIFLFPLYVWITTLSSRAWQKRQITINSDMDVSQGRFLEAISQMRAVKAFSRGLYELNLFSNKRDVIEQNTRDQSVEWHKYDIMRRLSLNVIFLGIYAYIVFQAITKTITLGEMTLLIQLATQVQFPLFAASFLIDNLQKAQAGSRDFFEVIAQKSEVRQSKNVRKLTVTKGAIEYRNVSFAYSTETNKILSDVSFTIKPGEKIALIGQSGEGKTTIANLLLGFYEPTKGSIYIDEQDLSQVTLESLREAIAMVFQDPLLFSGTVKENITYARPDSRREDMIRAANIANADGFISQLPLGYDSEIGERGLKLSGGQKQRIAIARAIFKDAPILILDEATSSLDSKAEIAVQEALEHLMQGRTTMIIAHRFSTIKNVDTIIGIKKGTIAEIGSPSSLAHKKNGLYAELLELQSSALLSKKYGITSPSESQKKV